MDFVNYDNTDIESNLLVDANSPGLMSAADKDKLDSILNIVNITQKEYDNLETKDPNTLYLIKILTSTLLSGSNFNTILKSVPNATTSVVFTNTAIPNDKISSAAIVSTEDSDVKAYMYLDNTTVYVSPEEDNAIIYANENCYNMFGGCSSLTSLDLSNFNTSKVTNMSSMFSSCSSLTSLDVSNWNTSNVTDMNYMFYYCNSLTSLDLSNFNTSKVTNMSYMFSTCMALTSLDVSNFDTSKVTDMNYMFRNCSALTSLDLSNFNTSKVTSMSNMFYNCNKAYVDITIMNPNITSYSSMFTGCSTDTLDMSIVRYIDDATHTIAQNMVATKSSNSKVYVYGEASGSPTAL